jgi:hypothetical protein
MNADKNPDFKSVSSVAYLLRNATAGAYEPPPMLFFNPFCQRRALWRLRAVLVLVMFTFRGLRAAMFTEPAITQIEEVGRLVHRS